MHIWRKQKTHNSIHHSLYETADLFKTIFTVKGHWFTSWPGQMDTICKVCAFSLCVCMFFFWGVFFLYFGFCASWVRWFFVCDGLLTWDWVQLLHNPQKNRVQFPSTYEGKQKTCWITDTPTANLLADSEFRFFFVRDLQILILTAVFQCKISDLARSKRLT